jgi:4-amino-4-deoxy-L-arabinose transferase-like glycosyltransferase
MSPGRLLTVFLVVATALRWWWNLLRPLSPEESYLALCGFIPSLAYFDGPGGPPLLVALGISVAGAGGFGAAFFWPVLAAAASAFLYLLVSSLVGKREGLAAAVLLNLLPVFNQASLHPSCALPLTAAALGTAVFAWQALEKNSAVFWILAGLSAALGLLFSYTAWFLLPAVALVLLASHRWRPRLAFPGFWLAWVPPLAVYLLLLQWNAQHGWVHFIGGTLRTALALDFSNLGPALLAAARATSPLVLLLLVFAAVLAVSQIRVSPKIKFVFLPALAALLAATYAALRGFPAQTSGLLSAALVLPLIAWLPAQFGRIPARLLTTVVFFAAAIWCAINLPRTGSTTFVDAKVGQEVQAIRTTHRDALGALPFLVAENAPLAAALALTLPDPAPAEPGHPPIYTVESAAARSQFDLWPRYDQFVEAKAPPTDPAALDPFTEQDGVNPFVGRFALYITTQQPDGLPQAVTAAFAAVQLLAEIPTPDGRTLRVYLCSDYQTMPL